jgi:DNA-binding FrmR family transcriptional regulator
VRYFVNLLIPSRGIQNEENDMAAPGYVDQKSLLQRRLRRVEGQVRGLQNMISEDRYCIEVLDQISATTRALQAVALELLDDHISHCVANAVKQGGPEKDEKIAEATAAIARLVRS